ncbi:sulfotransferase 1C1-like [Pseudophryne corroboree]|uniref:sulfotransferase 1C1-like n=1 Tax=Pseudophryne corroboree TaxID=495146 RepID=UPI0030815FE6
MIQRKLVDVQGMAIAECIADNWEEIWNFQARDGDVLLDTYPKSGTTWTQEIVDLIMHDADEQSCSRAPIYERIPFIELMHLMKPGVEEVNAMPSPRVLKTHLPIQLVPPSFWKHNCKVIYVARNARDTVTSFYHFDKILQFHPEPGSFENYVERFMKGDVGWGSWYEHVKGFWEEKDKRNILYVFFEDMKKTPLQEIRRVAQFLGKDFSDDVINKIAKLTTFEHMKNNPMANVLDFPKEILDQSQGNFMRKGTVGDWKTLFTAQQSEAFEEHYKKMMSGCTLKFQDPK